MRGRRTKISDVEDIGPGCVLGNLPGTLKQVNAAKEPGSNIPSAGQVKDWIE
jgi:hypothetical protein